MIDQSSLRDFQEGTDTSPGESDGSPVEQDRTGSDGPPGGLTCKSRHAEIDRKIAYESQRDWDVVEIAKPIRVAADDGCIEDHRADFLCELAEDFGPDPSLKERRMFYHQVGQSFR